MKKSKDNLTCCNKKDRVKIKAIIATVSLQIEQYSSLLTKEKYKD